MKTLNFLQLPLALLPIVLTACPGRPSATPNGNSAAAPRRGERGPATVQVQSISRKVVPRILEVTVNLVGRSQADVFARVAGKLSFLGPNEGDPVKAGQLLFKIDRTDPGENFLATPVESPISGWVGQWRVAVGTQVSPQDAVVLIVDDSTLSANVYLPVSDWSLVKKNTKAVVSANGETRSARVTTIARTADPVTGRGSFEVSIPNQDRNWKAGMVGVVRLEIDPRSRLLIPAQALSITDRGTFVYVAEEGVARRKPVTYELMNNDEVEILSGLGENAQVITAGNGGLADNSPIKIAKPRSQESRP